MIFPIHTHHNDRTLYVHLYFYFLVKIHQHIDDLLVHRGVRAGILRVALGLSRCNRGRGARRGAHTGAARRGHTLVSLSRCGTVGGRQGRGVGVSPVRPGRVGALVRVVRRRQLLLLGRGHARARRQLASRHGQRGKADDTRRAAVRAGAEAHSRQRVPVPEARLQEKTHKQNRDETQQGERKGEERF